MYHILLLMFLSFNIYAFNEDLEMSSAIESALKSQSNNSGLKRKRENSKAKWMEMIPQQHICNPAVCKKIKCLWWQKPEFQPNTQHVDLSSIKFRKLDGFEWKVGLKIINLSDNNLKEIPNLTSLVALNQLSLWNNQIGVFNPAETLPNKTVQYLDLSNNKISEMRVGNWRMQPNVVDFLELNRNWLTKSCFEALCNPIAGDGSILFLGLRYLRTDLCMDDLINIRGGFPCGGIIELEGNSPLSSKKEFKELEKKLNPTTAGAGIGNNEIIAVGYYNFRRMSRPQFPNFNLSKRKQTLDKTKQLKKSKKSPVDDSSSSDSAISLAKSDSDFEQEDQSMVLAAQILCSFSEQK